MAWETGRMEGDCVDVEFTEFAGVIGDELLDVAGNRTRPDEVLTDGRRVETRRPRQADKLGGVFFWHSLATYKLEKITLAC